MKDINLNIVATSGGATTVYVPVRDRGIVVDLKAATNKNVSAADTIDIQRGSTSVNKITVGSSNTSAGTVLTGTRDASNSELVFDPSSASSGVNVMKVVVSALSSASTVVSLAIQYDEMAIT